MWQSILYPPIFVRVIDMGLSFLFGWKARNISASQKLAAYPHLYSFTSTKSVVHWFQIIRNKSFQMYDDDVQPVVEPVDIVRDGGRGALQVHLPGSRHAGAGEGRDARQRRGGEGRDGGGC